MASESRDDGSVGVELPADLAEWLDERAAQLEVPREELVVQVLAGYRAAGERDPDDPLQDALSDALAADPEGNLSAAIENAMGDREGVTAADLDDLEAEFQAKIEDVRSRVIQVKQEADAKAPADHDHPEFREVAELERGLEEVRSGLTELRETVEDLATDVADQEAAAEDAHHDLAGRLEDAEEKLDRVAWVVSDLKEETSGHDTHKRAVDRIKRAAAQEGITNATCENCSESVHVPLLTDPECPHCNATVSDVRPEGGIIRSKARLVTASQLEAGDEDE